MKISEIFGPTLQGEGFHTGVPSIFIRLVGCSLRCQGFGQEDPTGMDIPWIDPLEHLDTKRIKVIEDVPKEAYTKTCDSNWAWHPKFKHLFRNFTPIEVIDTVCGLSSDGLTKVENGLVHLVISGGEPLLPVNQKNIIALLQELAKRIKTNNVQLTFETNGIQEMGQELIQTLKQLQINVTMSISPKLFTVAGEMPEKAIQPNVISQLIPCGNVVSYLKFVIGDEPRQEAELCEVISKMPSGVMIYIMPVGKDSVDVLKVRRHVAEIATKRGLRFSDRLHAHIWDNEMGR